MTKRDNHICEKCCESCKEIDCHGYGGVEPICTCRCHK